MRKRRINLLNNKYIIASHVEINKGTLAKQNYMHYVE
jgi:hypothetical protein